MTGDLRISIAHTLEPFDDLWPRLDTPGAGAHYVFQTAEMIGLWRRTIGAARKVLPIFVRIDAPSGEPSMLLPLGLERRRGARVLTFLDGGVSDYNAPVLFPASAALHAISPAVLWRALISSLPAFDVAILEKMPASVNGALNPLCRLAAGHAPPSGYSVKLSGSWEDFTRTSLHRFKDSRRKRRRLGEAGALRFVVAATQADVDRLFPILIAQKTRRYLELNGCDGFDRPGYREYFAAVTKHLHARGVAHLSAIEVDDTVLATHWGLLAHGRFYSLMLAYADHPLSAYSPARLLVEKLIAWCFAQRLQVFDLGYGDAAWKRHVGAERFPLFHAAIPATTLGWAYLEARRLRDSLAHPQSEQAA